MSNKRIAKNSILLYIRLIVTFIVGMFTSRYVLGALGASDYGLYNVVGGLVGMMAFVNSMMVTTTYRFIAFEEGKPDGDVNKVFNVSMSIHLATATVVLILAATIGVYYIANYLVVETGKLGDAYFVFVFSLINIVVEILGTPFRGLMVAKEKFAITVPIEIGTKILVLAVAILLNYIPFNHLRIYAALITIVHCLNPISYAIYAYRKFYNTIRWRLTKDKALYKAMLSFSGWNSLEVASTMGESQGSAIIINRFFGTILNASFGVARQINSVVFMFSSGLGQAVVPQITKSYSSGDNERSEQLVIMASKYSFFLMALPMFPILLEADFILSLWLKEVPVYTAIFVKAMLIKSIITTSQYGLGHLIDATGKVQLFKTVRSVLTLLSLPLAYMAFKMGYPPYTISYLYVGIALILFIANQYMLHKIIQFNTREFLLKSTLKILLICIMQIPIFILIRYFPSGFLRFFVFSIVCELILLASIYFLGIDKSEKQRIWQFIQSYIEKFKNKQQQGLADA